MGLILPALTARDPELETHLLTCMACGSLMDMASIVDGGLAVLATEPVDAPSFEALRKPARRAARVRRWRASARRALPAATLATCAAVCAALAMHVVGRPRVQPPRSYGAGEVMDASTGSRLGLLPDGSRITLESGKISIEAATRTEARIRLERGAVALEVPTRATGKLVVRTTDADVQVHGTKFSVAYQSAGTRVDVTEGLVEVVPQGRGRLTLSVRAGQSVTVEPLASFRARTRDEAFAAVKTGILGRSRSAVSGRNRL